LRPPCSSRRSSLFRAPAATQFPTLSLHDALPISAHRAADMIFEELTGIKGVFATRIAYVTAEKSGNGGTVYSLIVADADGANEQDRKSTRLNSSHVKISYAVFCLKKKTYSTGSSR